MKLIDILSQQIRSSAQYNTSMQDKPIAILWTDKLKQWQPAMSLLQAEMPEIVVLGEYEPSLKQGPAIWLKCLVAQTLPDLVLPAGKTPIIYLPGLERKDLRAIAECPIFLQPLAELQYRGCWWAYNSAGRDWTVNSFLLSKDRGAGLDVAQDEKSQVAMLRVLAEVLESEQSDLSNRRLEASDFNKLVSNDPIRDLLSWMNDAEYCSQNWHHAQWQAFSGICETEYHFSPKKDGVLTAAEMLCQRQGIWNNVWERFEESFNRYPKLPSVLLLIEGDLAADGSSYPILNLHEEEYLFKELAALLVKSSSAVRTAITELDKRHKARRNWIWNKLGLSPLANVLADLAVVANLTHVSFSGATAEEMAEHYKAEYWLADEHALRVLEPVLEPKQAKVIQSLLAIIYNPWLQEVAQNFQSLVREGKYPGDNKVNEATAQYQVGGEVVFFVDGLRFDIAHRLVAKLDSYSEVSLNHNWAALPSVTATAKAAVTPVHDRLTGRPTDRDFKPSLKDNDTSFSSYYLKKFLAEKKWQYLAEGETGNPSGNAWVQSGDIDKEGHIKGIKLAARIDILLEEIESRVKELLSYGWRKIRIVTDHGWLLTPQSMPKVDIPKHLTETRWGRCAVLKDSIKSEYLQVNWYWNPEVSIAMAPGISGFIDGKYYDHGGLSLQECLTPIIEVVNTAADMSSGVKASISSVRWLGLTCKVEVETDGEVYVCLRTSPADLSSEISKQKLVKNGKCTLMVEDDYEGTGAVLVLVDGNGELLAKKPMIVGDE
ncbi:BREX-1 system phosphatase PglZ type B [Paraglaciecola sp. 20A4]|uniref:BREX-1 system phosphatase PglZ type B n=1 Tax=Paraglaciecola sp. 20A4 TaxID=2687288 RepID=UPI00140AA02F|nr:BREX-1 system phosphatase PglZ type B [Paraglaciecola sp. 20A4]